MYTDFCIFHMFLAVAEEEYTKYIVKKGLQTTIYMI